MSDNQRADVDRRSVLGGVATLGAATVGATGLAGAVSGGEPRAALSAKTTAVVNQLTAAGVISAPTDLDLPTRSPTELIEGADGVTRLTTDGTTLRIAQRQFDGGQLRVFLDERTDEAHAVLDRGDEQFLVTADGRRRLTDHICYYDCTTTECRTGDERVEVIVREDADGNCEYSDYDCGC